MCAASGSPGRTTAELLSNNAPKFTFPTLSEKQEVGAQASIPAVVKVIVVYNENTVVFEED